MVKGLPNVLPTLNCYFKEVSVDRNDRKFINKSVYHRSMSHFPLTMSISRISLAKKSCASSMTHPIDSHLTCSLYNIFIW